MWLFFVLGYNSERNHFAMKFLHEMDEEKELTYEDVFLVPSLSAIPSRMDVDLTPSEQIGTTNPIVIANMTAMAGKRMAETVARRGGLVVLPQDMDRKRLQEVIGFVKSRHTFFDTPVALHAEESLQTAMNLIYKRSHGAIMVVDSAGKPIGIVTEKDADGRDRFASLESIMTKEVLSVPARIDPKSAFIYLHEKRLNVAPAIDESGKMIGILSKKGALRSHMHKPAVNQKGELLTSVAIGANAVTEEYIDWLKQIGVDVFVIDAAHGHQKRMLDAVQLTRRVLGADVPIVAGNIVTANAVQDLVSAGATILKVGIGPGAMCTTRMKTGVGRPQFSAVKETAEAAKKLGASVWADGGVRNPRDVALALAAGASSVMVGSWFAGTYESPADIQRDAEGRLYKVGYGMASKRAVLSRASGEDAFKQAERAYFEEGISQSRLYLKKGEESAEDIIDAITAGVRSACTYSGAQNLREFSEKAIVGVQTYSGFSEGKALEKGW